MKIVSNSINIFYIVFNADSRRNIKGIPLRNVISRTACTDLAIAIFFINFSLF